MSEDTFVHDIAVDISRVLNLTNPNDLIAKKVIQFAETNKDFEKFSKGMQKKDIYAFRYPFNRTLFS